MRTIEAVFRNGVFLPSEPVDLPEGAHVSLSTREADAPAPPRGWIDPSAFAGLVGRLPVDPLAFQQAIRAEWDRASE